MKAEQEIVLQKKMIIIFSLVILTIIMGILNIQKEKIRLASQETYEDYVCYDDNIVKVYNVYSASEELFKIEVSGEAVSLVEEFQSGEEVKDEINNEIAVASNSVEENIEKTEEIKKEEVIVDIEEGNQEEKVNESEEVQEKIEETIEEDSSVIVASRGSYVRDPNPPPTEYERVIQVKATAYCLCKKCCGKSPNNPRYGYTASGLRIVPGTGMKVIAVDTSVVPLGTNVYVEGLYGAGNYGYAIAADTGSAIKNNKIDLYMDTHGQALAWGVKTVNLYILGE